MHKMKSAKSLTKPPSIIAPTVARNLENDMQFELELCWCIQQLENALCSGKLAKKIAEDTEKNLKSLKSSTAPLIKKRQIMKAALGDYRAKMKEEEKKMALVPREIKFTQSADAVKSSFVKKAAILSSGNNFKFNFQLPEKNSSNAVQNDTNVVNSNSNLTGLGRELNLTTGQEFKFNFSIEETNEDLNMKDLSISS